MRRQTREHDMIITPRPCTLRLLHLHRVPRTPVPFSIPNLAARGSASTHTVFAPAPSPPSYTSSPFWQAFRLKGLASVSLPCERSRVATLASQAPMSKRPADSEATVEMSCSGKKRVLRRRGTLVTRNAVSINKEMKEQMDFFFLNGAVQVLTLTQSHVPGAQHLVQDHSDDTATFKILELEYSSCDVTSATHMEEHGNRCVGELLMVIYRGQSIKPGDEMHNMIRQMFVTTAERDLVDESQGHLDTQQFEDSLGGFAASPSD